MSVKVSVLILSLNAEDTIERALDSVSWAEEVIVIDSGSDDATKKIVFQKRRLFVYRQFKDYSSQRNFALSKTHNDLVLYLDADEEVDADLRRAIEKIADIEPGYVGFRVKRRNFFLGKPWPGEEYLERIFYKKFLIRWVGQIHESPVVNGQISTLDGMIIHTTHRSLEAMLEKTLKWSAIEAQNRFDMAHPKITSWRIWRMMITGFWDYYFYQGGYRIGTVGLIESIYQGYSQFVTYARLWELQTAKKGSLY